MTPTPAEEDSTTATPTAAAAAETTATATPAEEAAATTTATPEPLSDDELISRGEAVYATYCAACHQLDGQGITNAYPALAENPFVLAEDPAGVLRIVFTGRAGMPHFRDYLSEQEIAAAVSYVRNGWENSASVVTIEEVQTVREEIYSPFESSDHNGGSDKDGSSAPDKDEQDSENGQE
jgi:mono/diheme cytochrome c family protein